MIRQRLVASIALALALSLPLTQQVGAQSADEMTAEELMKAFEQQKTRGLVLVPADNANTDVGNTATVAATEPTYTPATPGSEVNIKIKFDFDSATLREDQKPRLATLCEVMKSVDVQLFQIVGHTDSSGSASYNEKLSLLRAQEVKRHLVNDCGIPETRLEAVGMGEAVPFNPNDPRSDENRRVEFQALG
jgi:outer membrane protein OmpA-like peptidoglycan-associated protein